MTTTNPGSLKAREQGCTCAVMDNNYGADGGFDGLGNFWLSDSCPLHGTGVQPTEVARVRVDPHSEKALQKAVRFLIDNPSTREYQIIREVIAERERLARVALLYELIDEFEHGKGIEMYLDRLAQLERGKDASNS
jgi:hypothetical protein